MTISLAAVFIPILFMGGILGRLFHEFAVTIGVAILVSGFVSLTLTPMLCSRFLKPQSTRQRARPALRVDASAASTACCGSYERDAGRSLRPPARSLVFSASILVGDRCGSSSRSRRASCRREDQGQIFGSTEAAQGIAFDGDARDAAGRWPRSSERTPRSRTRSCPAAGRAEHRGRQRGHHLHAAQAARASASSRADEIIAASCGAKLAKVPGIRVFLQIPPPIRIGGSLTKSQYQYTLQDSDTAELYEYAPHARGRRCARCPRSQDVTTRPAAQQPPGERRRSTATGPPRSGVTTAADRGRALHGLRHAPGLDDLRAEQRSTRSSSSSRPSSSPTRRRSPMLYVRARAGRAGPARVARLDLPQGVGPLTVHHSGQLPAVTISFNLRRASSLGDAVAAVDRVARADAARHHQHQLPGHGAGVPDLPAGARAAAAHRDPRHLPRARDPLRELHPPAHDPLRAAVRRLRRARDADGLRHGAVDLRASSASSCSSASSRRTAS